jgi:4,5-DOPA dioxygenase extradiol
MPAVFLSHGAPHRAADLVWTRELADWSARLGRPAAILVVSAHWEAAPLTLGATTTVPLTYDFWGFEERFYQVRYPAPGAPQLARQVQELFGSDGYPIAQEPHRGLDHGAYVPLVEMYPEADIPVLQISMPTLDPQVLVDLGRRLAPLRDQGVLIIGSGFSTHNLRAIDPSAGTNAAPPSWSAEFDDWLAKTLEANEVDDLIDFQRKAPAASVAHPRTEHFAPLFVALGTSLSLDEAGETAIDGFFMGLSKRSVQFG